MGRVDGKRAILTGAASGIGRATAELFAREGAHVVIADLNEAGAKEVAAAIRDDGGKAHAQLVNIGDPGSVAEMVAASVRVLGGLDILFNNAADTSAATMALDGALATMEVDVWDHCMNVDLRGAMLCAKHAIPHLIEAGGGSIINTSSNLSLAADLSQTAYTAAKAGINSLTRSIATQYGEHSIRCNAVSPGAILTPRGLVSMRPEMREELARHSPISRMGKPEDLAYAVLYLASDESTYVSGQLLSIDGGQLAHLPHFAFLKATGAQTTGQESS